MFRFGVTEVPNLEPLSALYFTASSTSIDPSRPPDQYLLSDMVWSRDCVWKGGGNQLVGAEVGAGDALGVF